MQAGVPRDCIIANRMDTTSKESKTRLPYPSGSISLVICNLGLSELVTKREERTLLFQELVRVLEPEGRMVIVEKAGVGTSSSRNRWRGSTASYRDILVEEMGWERERVTTQSHMCIKYLVAVKPSGTSKIV
jgi:ubiquinone/menaquinone biosynthesis C-methylase UbiE